MLEGFLIFGPEGRTRTDTSSLTADFESAASTNFTTSGKVVIRIIAFLFKLSTQTTHDRLILKQRHTSCTINHQFQPKNRKKTILSTVFFAALSLI